MTQKTKSLDKLILLEDVDPEGYENLMEKIEPIVKKIGFHKCEIKGDYYNGSIKIPLGEGVYLHMTRKTTRSYPTVDGYEELREYRQFDAILTEPGASFIIEDPLNPDYWFLEPKYDSLMEEYEKIKEKKRNNNEENKYKRTRKKVNNLLRKLR